MKIKELRRRLFLTQVDFAKKLGMSKTAVSNWETGISIPSIENLLKIKEICDSNGLKYEDYVE